MLWASFVKPIKYMSTIVKVECASKKESKNYDAKNPIQYSIELNVPYDPKSIYHQLSGQSGIILNTINKDAADLFVIGKSYDVVISASEDIEYVPQQEA